MNREKFYESPCIMEIEMISEQTVIKSESRTLATGKAIKLSDQGWTAVVD